MYVVTYLQTNTQKADPGIIFLNTEEELARYMDEMGVNAVPNTTILNHFVEADGFECIITEV